MDELNQWLALAVSVTVLLGALGGYLRWVRPRLREMADDRRAIKHAIVGREATVDSITGREVQPALPGIGVRMAVQEEQMAALTKAVAQIAESHARIASVESRVTALENKDLERFVTKVESIEAYRAIQDAFHATTEEETK